MNPSETSPVELRAGEPFRPYNLFVGPLIPITLLQDQSLNPLAKLLFACLSMHLGKSGDRCNPRSKVLAAELGASDAQIERAFKELVDVGLIRRKSNGPGRAWETEIIWHPMLDGSLKGRADSANMQNQPVDDSASVRTQDGVDSANLSLDSAPVRTNDSANLRTYRKGSVEKVKEKVQSGASRDSRSSPELLTALREYFNAPINGRLADRGIIARVAAELGDVDLIPLFRKIVRRWLLNNEPQGFGIFIELARDARAASLKGDATDKTPAAARESSLSRSLAVQTADDSPDRAASAPRTAKAETRDAVLGQSVRRAGLHRIGGSDLGWLHRLCTGATSQ